MNRAEVWSRYWLEVGRATRAPGSFAEGQAGDALAQWWRCRMREHESESNWLDIGTGNGALPVIWNETISRPKASLHAVDLARIQIDRRRFPSPGPADRVVWTSLVNVESLPFSDASLDVAMSQFGFEYARTDQAVSEVARVLRSNGHLLLAMHHAGGLPVRLAGVEMAHMDSIRQPGGLLELTHQMIIPLTMLRSPQGRAAVQADTRMDELRLAFNSGQDELGAAIATSACPDVLHETQDMIARACEAAIKGDPGRAAALLDRFNSQLTDSRFRLQELVRHALSIEGMQDLSRRLSHAFAVLEASELTENGQTLGWLLAARRL